MLFALGENGNRIRAASNLIGHCPGCNNQLIPKCGRINIHHWAHKAGDCDPWYEPESRWHLWWKTRAPESWCEVSMGNHRADIRRSDGLVIELQRSALSVDEIAEREAFYGTMIWVVDVRRYAGPIFVEPADSDAVEVRWDRSFPKGWRQARRPLYLDLGPRIVHVQDHLGAQGRARGLATSRRQFLRQFQLDDAGAIDNEEFGVWLILEGSHRKGKPLARFFKSRSDADAWPYRSPEQSLVLADGTVVDS
jgi:hypothetical protein